MEGFMGSAERRKQAAIDAAEKAIGSARSAWAAVRRMLEDVDANETWPETERHAMRQEVERSLQALAALEKTVVSIRA
jgi:hypothetical protein